MSIIVIIIIMINDHCYYNTFRCLAIEAEAFKDYILLPVIIIPFIPSTLPSWVHGLFLATIVGRIRWDLGRMFLNGVHNSKQSRAPVKWGNFTYVQKVQKNLKIQKIRKQYEKIQK